MALLGFVVLCFLARMMGQGLPVESVVMVSLLKTGLYPTSLLVARRFQGWRGARIDNY